MTPAPLLLDVLDIAQACRCLGVGRDKLRALRNRRIDPLPWINLDGAIRFDPEELAAWRRRQTVRANAPKPMANKRPAVTATPDADHFLKSR